MAVQIDYSTPETPESTPDSTPTGLNKLTGQDTGKVTGSAQADRGTMDDVRLDTDQVVKLGAGDDIFVFSTDSQLSDLNGIVYGGTGTDTAYLAHRIEDYQFTIREGGGGIKIQNIIEPDGSGDALTFYQFETFVFRNFVGGDNYENIVLTQSQLLTLIDPINFPAVV